MYNYENLNKIDVWETHVINKFNIKHFIKIHFANY